MEHKVTHDPAFSLLQVDIEPGETLVSEPGAMVAMSRHVELEAKLTTSPDAAFGDKVKAMFAAVIRKFLGGESFFVTHYTASKPATVWLAPVLSGSVVHHNLEHREVTLSSGAYMASMGNIDVIAKYGGLSGLLAKEGLFFLQVNGTGDIWFNSFGGVDEIDVDGSYTVDNGHIVGWTGDLDFTMKRAGGGLLGLFASGEGRVCEFTGKGKLWIQSRNVTAIVDWLIPLLPLGMGK